MWTLKYNGLTKSFPDWGILLDWSVNFSSKEKSTVYITTNEKFDPATLQFGFDQPVIIYDDDGSIYFQGYVGEATQQNEGGSQHVQYPIHDCWWLAERELFRQVRHQFTGWSDAQKTIPVYTNIVLPEVYLGEQINQSDTSYQTNGEQISEILSWINESWNPTRRGATSGIISAQDVLTIGTIEPSTYFYIQKTTSILCQEAIAICLRYTPDAVILRDLTTTPPTIHVLREASLPVKTIVLPEQQEKRISLTPQYMRQVPGVCITYKRMDTVDSVVAFTYTYDRYPANINEFIPEVIGLQFDLGGYSASSQSSKVTVTSLAALVSGDAATKKAWFLAHDTSLQDPAINSNSINIYGLTVTDEDGNELDTTNYPNILDDIEGNTLADWMGVTQIKAVIRANAYIEQFVDSTHIMRQFTGQRPVHVQVTLTNATSKTYTQTSVSSWAEDPPAASLAQQVYEGLQKLQYSGTLTLVNKDYDPTIRPGAKLKLIGPNHIFENCIVQNVRETPCHKTQEITFGPLDQYDAERLFEIFRAARMASTTGKPSGRGNGGIA